MPRSSHPTTPAYRPGDRVALVHTTDPHTRLRPGDTGTVTRFDPRLGLLAVDWDTGSTLSLLTHDGDVARRITDPNPTPAQPTHAQPTPDPRP